jgi:hypothetical protein
MRLYPFENVRPVPVLKAPTRMDICSSHARSEEEQCSYEPGSLFVLMLHKGGLLDE